MGIGVYLLIEKHVGVPAFAVACSEALVLHVGLDVELGDVPVVELEPLLPDADVGVVVA